VRGVLKVRGKEGEIKRGGRMVGREVWRKRGREDCQV
jgi:hypothetical protein